MVEITAQMVAALRAKTGAGLIDCKKALAESNGNEEEAVVILKKKGIASAAKKAGRSAQEGLIASYIHNGGKLGGLEWRFLWCHQAVHLLGSDDLGVGGLGAFRYLLGLEMTVAEGDGYDELAPLLQVVGLDGAVVHLYQRAGEVEADARAQVAVVDARWGLVEPLEDALQFVGGYLLAVVADGDVGLLVVVGEPYLDLTIGRGELDGVGEDVDQHFVELLAVDPHGQLVGVVLIDEIDALGAGLEFE